MLILSDKPDLDVPLFSKRMLEGEYGTYNFIWSRNYGAAVLLDSVKVDNFGNVYTMDTTAVNAYYRTFAGVETNTANYTYWLEFFWHGGSTTRKYILGSPNAPVNQIDVWREGVLLFSRVITLDEPLINGILLAEISPNGKFVAIICLDAITGNTSWILLYEGV